MIEFEVIDSIDKILLGKHRFFAPRFLFGRSSKSVIKISDPLLEDEAILLFLKETGLFIKNIEQGFYHINEKKFGGVKKLDSGDVVKFSQTKIKILEYSFDKIYPTSLEKDESLLDNEEHFNHLLSALEDELLFLDQNQDD